MPHLDFMASNTRVISGLSSRSSAHCVMAVRNEISFAGKQQDRAKFCFCPSLSHWGRMCVTARGLPRSSVCVQCRRQGYGLIYYTYVCFLEEHSCEALSFENHPLNSLKLDFDVPELPVPPVIMMA